MTYLLLARSNSYVVVKGLRRLGEMVLRLWGYRILYGFRNTICYRAQAYGGGCCLCHMVWNGYRPYHRSFRNLMETNFRLLCRNGYYINCFRYFAYHQQVCRCISIEIPRWIAIQ